MKNRRKLNQLAKYFYLGKLGQQLVCLIKYTPTYVNSAF
ncbi:MAG: hypothetical protein AVDCRST_MAG95-3428 [uncultured Adhaeribacter sp.]|uniref:Uncharacterized protein n=1 Tax=uncultured Adhaeribacter sp. TaxID=448109 RepID=A0A6J4JN27_9BACT|nr:MAG: hypothetical protein AVDCRST_MAG95-3428 [uncultured Adhaeribacter sp.]